MGPLVVRDLGAWHGAGDARREVFVDLSFTVESGEVLAVFGLNGCGKTTLLRVLAGLHPIGHGAVERPGRVALVPQGIRASFFPWASLRFNIGLGAGETLSSLREGAARADALREALGMTLDLGLRPGQCSEGMLQQAAILRGLCRRPDLLLADEPFSSLDINAARALRRALREAVTRGGMAAVVVLHDVESVAEIADRVLVIPGRPWAGSAREGFARAEIVTNNRLRDGAAREARPVPEVVRAVLGGGGRDA